MELACALVLLIIGSVTGSPYGYGIKGGARADAHAVAGAYTGAGSIPLNIPSGPGYSGSFSQSSSSSSSSASSSARTFSYSGSGNFGGINQNSGDCSSGKCNYGGTGFQGAAISGSQAYSGTNAGSIGGGYGSTVPAGSYGHKYGHDEGDCGSKNCRDHSNLNSSNGNTGAQYQSSGNGDATTAIVHNTGSDCSGPNCKNLHSAVNNCASGDCGAKVKCTTGDCGAGGAAVYNLDTQNSKLNKCTSGQCKSNQDAEGNSSIDRENYDINVHTSGPAIDNSNYDASQPDCASGNCGTHLSTTVSGYSKPALITSGISTSQLNIVGNIAEPETKNKEKENIPSSFYTGGFGGPSGILKPNDYSITHPSYDNKPALTNSATTDKPSCVSGICDKKESPSLVIGESLTSVQGSVKPSKLDCTPGNPGCTITSSGCTSGNCGSLPSSQICAPGTPCSGSPPSVPSEPTDFLFSYPTTGGAVSVSKGSVNDATSSSSGQTSAGISSSNYGTSSVGSSLNQGTNGLPGTGSLQTPKQPTGPSTETNGIRNSEFLFTPSSSGITSGISNSQLDIASSTAEDKSEHTEKDRPTYTGGFGGPSGILIPNEYSITYPSSNDDKPALTNSVTPAKPSCVSGICDKQESPSPVSSGSLTSIQGSAGATASINAGSYSGGFGAPLGVLKPSGHGAPSSPSYNDKPSGSNGLTTIKPSCVSGSCDTQEPFSLVNNESSTNIHAAVGATASTNAGSSYSGGFGAPSEVLKPTEHSSPTSLSYGNKPTVSNSQTTIKPICVSGICDYAINSENNDINVHTLGSASDKSIYDSSQPGCSSGNCGSHLSSTTTISNNKPAQELTVPKLEPACTGSNCQISTSGYYTSSSQTKIPHSSTNPNGNQLGHVSSGYGGVIKPSNFHGSSPYSPVKPLPLGSVNCARGTPGCSTTASFSNPSPFGHSTPSPFGHSTPSPFGHSTPSPFGHSTPSPFGHSTPSPFGHSTPSPFGHSTPSPFAHGTPSPFGHGSQYSSIPNYSHGNTPLVNPSNLGCVHGSFGCIPPPLPSKSSECAFGNCGTHFSIPSNIGNKPNYAHGNYQSVQPLAPLCAPGTLGCGSNFLANKPSYYHGSSPSYSNLNPLAPPSLANKPSYYHESSPSYSDVKPLASVCAPGSPGCRTSLPSGSSGCASGNCDGSTTFSVIKPINSHESSSPLQPVCVPGSPGCTISSTPNSPSTGCASGNCEYPSAPGHSATHVIKPNYSQGSPAFSTLIPSDPACNPGSPGCSLPANKAQKPGYSYETVTAQLNPSLTSCAPGIPGCQLPLTPTSQSGCKSGNCNKFPPLGQANLPSVKPSYTESSLSGASIGTKPSYSYGNLPSHAQVKPSGLGCTSGTPGCTVTLSGCTSGNCGSLPSSQICAPGTPGCSGSPSSVPSGPTGFAFSYPTAGGTVPVSGGSNNDVISLNSGQTSAGISPSNYGTSSVGSSLNQGTNGLPGTGSLQTPKQPTGPSTETNGIRNSEFLFTPSSSGITSGISNSQLDIASSTAEDKSEHTEKDRPTYTGGFGGPSGILIPNEYSITYPSSNDDKPALTNSVTPAKPSCVSGICDKQESPSPVSSGSLTSIQGSAGATASINAGSYSGGFGAPLGVLKPSGNGAPSSSSYNNKPSGSNGLTTIKPSCVSGTCDTQGPFSLVNNESSANIHAAVGVTASTNTGSLYSGGFGAPSGVLKPIEHGSPASSSDGDKLTGSNGQTTIKPSCISGTCDTKTQTPSATSVTSGAHASADAAASADAVAYSGGFGGPPGLLKPYDNGKGDLKETSELAKGPTSLHLNQEVGSSDSIGGSLIGGNANVQAIATAGSSTGANYGDSLHGNNGGSHGYDVSGGCVGGCAGSGSGSLGYTGSFGFSKTDVLDGPINGLATAGAAKSVANAFSGARAFSSSSYGSSSSTAHAGASVKGGYGRR